MEGESRDILRGHPDRVVVHEFGLDPRVLIQPLQAIHLHPVKPVVDPQIRRLKHHALRMRIPRALPEKCHHLRIIHARRARKIALIPPVVLPRLFAIGDLIAQSRQHLHGPPRVGDRHVVVVGAMEHKGRHVQRILHERLGPILLDDPLPDGSKRGRRIVIVLAQIHRPVQRKAVPSRARRHRGKPIRMVQPHVPYPMPAHRVPGEVDPIRIDPVPLLHLLQHLQRIPPSPVLPVEPEAPPVRRSHHERPVLGCVRSHLAVRADTGPVQREDQRVCPLRIEVRGRPHRKVLRGFVHLRTERDPNRHVLLSHADRNPLLVLYLI